MRDRRSIATITTTPKYHGITHGHSIRVGQFFWGKWTRDGIEYGNQRELWVKAHTCVTQLSGATGTTVSNKADFRQYEPVDVDITVLPWQTTKTDQLGRDTGGTHQK